MGCSVNANNSPPGKIEEFIPLTGSNNYFQDEFDVVWNAIGSKMSLVDSAASTTLLDNGLAISWNFSIPPAGFVTYSHVTTFSPLGKEGLVTSKTADSPTAPAGTQTGYTITIKNPNESDVIVGTITVNSITDSLPAGFVLCGGLDHRCNDQRSDDCCSNADLERIIHRAGKRLNLTPFRSHRCRYARRLLQRGWREC